MSSSTTRRRRTLAPATMRRAPAPGLRGDPPGPPQLLEDVGGHAGSGRKAAHSTLTRSVAPRPKVSGAYISSARGGGTTKRPGVVARATYR